MSSKTSIKKQGGGEEPDPTFIQTHFFYEVKELLNAKFFLQSVKNGDLVYSLPVVQNKAALVSENLVRELGTISMNIALEHALMHARILYEFYFRFGKDAAGKDMNPHRYPRANLYVADFRIPEYTQYINQEFEDKVNNQIAHLGTERFEEPSKKFNYAETSGIINDLLRITYDFIQRLDAKYQTGEIKALSSNIEKVIGPRKQ